MAIAFDASNQGARNVSATGSITWNHTCTGANLILLVGVTCTGDNVTGVTYNGVAMTLIDKTASVAGDFNYLYALQAPATGSNAVVVSLTGTHFLAALSASYTGVNQSVTLDSHTPANTTTATPWSMSTTVVAANCWLVSYNEFTNSSTTTAGSGTTQRQIGNTGQDRNLFDSNGTVSTGSQTLNYVFNGGSQAVGGIIASLAPAAVTATSHLLGSMGVGA